MNDERNFINTNDRYFNASSYLEKSIDYLKKSQTNQSNDDLMLAIKQVAKEMAEAVKTSQKQVTKEDTKSINQVEQNKEEKEYDAVEYDKDDVNNSYYAPIYSEYQQTKTFYEREIEAHNALQHKLEIIRNKKKLDEVKDLKSKPTLSKNTQKIIQNKLKKERPIYQRVEEVLVQKEENLYELKRAAYDEEVEEQLEHVSRWNVGHVDDDKFGNFLKTQSHWQQYKQEKLEYLKGEYSRFEEQEQKSYYKPTINKASEAIALNKNRKLRDKTVHERLHNQHEEKLLKKEKLAHQDKPSFTPVINKKIPKYLAQGKRDLTPVAVRKGKIHLNRSTVQTTNNSADYADKGYIETPNENLISIYGHALEQSDIDSHPVTAYLRNMAKEAEQKKTEVIKETECSQYSWTKELISVGQENKASKATSSKSLKSLYKLNTSSATSWNKNIENILNCTPKFSGVVKNIMK